MCHYYFSLQMWLHYCKCAHVLHAYFFPGNSKRIHDIQLQDGLMEKRQLIGVDVGLLRNCVYILVEDTNVNSRKKNKKMLQLRILDERVLKRIQHDHIEIV